IRLPAKLGFPFAPSLLRGGGKPLWFDKLTTNGFPYFWVLQEVYCNFPPTDYGQFKSSLIYSFNPKNKN
ncbi:hypothetical protein, partial [Moraxella caprae]|uniref:hypothetical protein n=1 Tax=Moraxella caprae TaxID=90240 RepID=UPI0005678FDA